MPNIDPIITLTRASNATHRDEAGLIVTAANNVARPDHDPVTFAQRGYLIEEQRTNLGSRAEEISDAYWGKTAATITADSVAAPDGATTADRIVETAVTSQHKFFRNNFTVTSGVNITASIFVKKGERTWFWMELDPTGTSQAFFDLENGVVGTTSGAAFVSARITAAAKGFYRCEITSLSTTTTAHLTMGLASADNTNTYLGDITKGLHAWGAQLEDNASFASSYIKTTTGAVTRSADVASTTDIDWLDANEGTFVVKFSIPADALERNTEAIVTIDDGSQVNDIYLSISNSPSINNVQLGTSNGVGLNPGTVTPGTASKVAFRYKLNDFAISMDGGAVIKDTNKTVPTGLSVFRWFKRAGSASNLTSAHIESIEYRPSGVTDAQLVTLSK